MQDTHRILRLAVLGLASTALVACSSNDDDGGLIETSAPPVVVETVDNTPIVDVDNGPTVDNSSDDVEVDSGVDDAVIVDDGANIDTDALIDMVADKLLAGEISAPLRQEITGIMALIPDTETALRAAEAIYLVVSSPEFAYQK